MNNFNKGGQAYNILNADYEKNVEGQFLRRQHDDTKVKNMMRMNQLNNLGNTEYNLITGNPRSTIDVPHHHVYNPGH